MFKKKINTTLQSRILLLLPPLVLILKWLCPFLLYFELYPLSKVDILISSHTVGQKSVASSTPGKPIYSKPIQAICVTAYVVLNHSNQIQYTQGHR